MRRKEKGENRKALPKFLAVTLAAGVVGGILGFFSGVAGAGSLPEAIVSGIESFLKTVSPWAIWIMGGAFLGAGVVEYRRAQKLYRAWDGEDEETMDQVNELLSWALLTAQLTMIAGFFFFPAGMQFDDMSGGASLSLLLSFVAAMVGMIVLQQKTVDLLRTMNPEKQGSVYDMKFQKKWLESCDEAERKEIGEASFKAFKAANFTCVGLWAALIFLDNVFDIGLLPLFIVVLIWTVLLISYSLACLQQGRRNR